MAMGVLETLFGSKARVRIMRFFLLNPELVLPSREVAQKVLLPAASVRKELAVMERIGFVKSRKRGGIKTYMANLDFPFRGELTALFARETVAPECRSLKRLSSIGDVHLALIGGIFLNYTKARADLFIVANDVSRTRLNKVIKALEAEVGKEIRYVVLSTEELKYRINMTDRFLRDFFTSPHNEVINKMPQFRRIVAKLRRK